MNILFIMLVFILVLIVFYILLAVFFFGRNYKIKIDKMFSNTVKAILENPETDKKESNDILFENKVSIKSLSEKNSGFKYLKGKNQNGGSKNE